MARPGGRVFAWFLAALVCMAGAMAIALSIRGGKGDEETREGQIRPGADARPSPPATGAFATGGRPSRGQPALERAFGKALPDYAIALDRWATERRTGHAADEEALRSARGAVLADEIVAALGEAPSEKLGALLDRARDAAVAPSSTIDRAADALSRAVLELDDELAAAGLGYLVDSDVMEYPDEGRRLVLLFSFAVAHVSIYRTAAGQVRALHLERLDQLNWTYTLLGFTSPRRREALILVEQVDERLVDRVLPQLGRDPPPFYILDEVDRQRDWYPRLAARATEVVRREYGETSRDPAVTARLGDLLARRKRLFASWERLLSRRGISITSPAALRLDWDYQKELAELVDPGEIRALSQIETELESPELAAAFADARATLIETVERHEVQHRLDNVHADPLPLSEELEDFVGPLTDARGEVREMASHANAELSAYLAELARDARTTGVGATILTQFVIAPPHWNTAECYAALVILEELAKELEVPGQGPLVDNHEVDRRRVTDTYLALTDLPMEELRRAARRLWERLFKRSLEEIERL